MKDKQTIVYYNGFGLEKLKLSEKKREIIVKPNHGTQLLRYPCFPQLQMK